MEENSDYFIVPNRLTITLLSCFLAGCALSVVLIQPMLSQLLRASLCLWVCVCCGYSCYSPGVTVGGIQYARGQWWLLSMEGVHNVRLLPYSVVTRFFACLHFCDHQRRRYFIVALPIGALSLSYRRLRYCLLTSVSHHSS